MPRGMDERFEDPSGPSEQKDTTEITSGSSISRSETEPSPGDVSSVDNDSDELNIREDWDPATIYVEPELSEEMEIAFTRLKKQLKRDGHTVRKNEHFYQAIFEIAFEDHQEQTKERVRELAKQDSGSQ